MAPWQARLRTWIGGPLEGSQREAFKAESAEADARRLRVLLPLMLVLHAAHIALFRTSEAMRATLAPGVVRWRQDLVLAHAATLALALPLTFLAYYRPARARVTPLLGPAAALLYIVHGAVIAGVDQLSMANVTVFIGYALGIAVVVCPPPLVTLFVYSVGLASFVVAIETMQSSPNGRLMVLPNGFSSTAVSVALALLLYGARRRDFAQRMTIGRQREELAEMNANLERRVREQVSEIVARARQIEQLNAQLQAQVRARSTELSMALAKLARDRDEGGRLRKGVVLGDRFVIDELIGEGGMGAVYSGTDQSTKESVAIKVIQASSAQQLDALHRFLREAGTAATVTHPAVVRMLHVDVSADGMLFQVQELVRGETLYRRLLKDSPWDVDRVARLGAVLCDALAAAHAQGVVHRDVKPGNIMVTRTAPGLKLLDFGISKLLPRRGRDASSGSGEIIGTPGYMAPEQLSGGKVTDRADVYAVGVILFRMITGVLPFDDVSMQEILLRNTVEPPPDVRTLVPTLAPAMAGVVARCLAIDPVERPAATQVASELTVLADASGAPSLDVIVRDDSRQLAARGASEAETVAAGKRTPPN
ncbi:MAG: serine/threonine-protein kinase [Polyangiaceae bacterium]